MNEIGIWCNTAEEIAEATLDLQCNYFKKEIGFPMIIRPSYVIGGRGMRIAYNRNDFKEAMRAL